MYVSILWGYWVWTKAGHLTRSLVQLWGQNGQGSHLIAHCIWEWDWGRRAKKRAEGNGESLEPSQQLQASEQGWLLAERPLSEPAEPLCLDTIQEGKTRKRIKKDLLFLKAPSYFTILFNSSPTYSYFHLSQNI